jgi:septal ring factor EnvC (AmiA/AmiB activator)
VTELELVNDLLRSRITQLESSESAARQSEAALRDQLKKLSEENEQLSKRLADTPSPTSNATNDDRQSKRIKISDML